MFEQQIIIITMFIFVTTDGIKTTFSVKNCKLKWIKCYFLFTQSNLGCLNITQ